MAVLSAHIINDFLPSLKAEINIYIRHGYTFRIQESFKEQMIAYGVNIRYSETIRHNTPRRAASARPDGNAIAFCIIDKIPYNQKIIHIPHSPDYIQFI